MDRQGHPSDTDHSGKEHQFGPDLPPTRENVSAWLATPESRREFRKPENIRISDLVAYEFAHGIDVATYKVDFDNDGLAVGISFDPETAWPSTAHELQPGEDSDVASLPDSTTDPDYHDFLSGLTPADHDGYRNPTVPLNLEIINEHLATRGKKSIDTSRLTNKVLRKFENDPEHKISPKYYRIVRKNKRPTGVGVNRERLRTAPANYDVTGASYQEYLQGLTPPDRSGYRTPTVPLSFRALKEFFANKGQRTLDLSRLNNGKLRDFENDPEHRIRPMHYRLTWDTNQSRVTGVGVREGDLSTIPVNFYKTGASYQEYLDGLTPPDKKTGHRTPTVPLSFRALKEFFADKAGLTGLRKDTLTNGHLRSFENHPDHKIGKEYYRIIWEDRGNGKKAQAGVGVRRNMSPRGSSSHDATVSAAAQLSCPAPDPSPSSPEWTPEPLWSSPERSPSPLAADPSRRHYYPAPPSPARPFDTPGGNQPRRQSTPGRH
ncbi:hypothetical protein [Micromonospora sp. SH-82]|uniref:hypothetical protein n=1 Tax=Micromonospora sp. SH-82 TaxID=3132938 RepID=UPI003EBC064B